jgi:Calcineurin-like phosphoesterase
MQDYSHHLSKICRFINQPPTHILFDTYSRNICTVVPQSIIAIVTGFMHMNFNEKCGILFQLLVIFTLMMPTHVGFATQHTLKQSENKVMKNATMPKNVYDTVKGTKREQGLKPIATEDNLMPSTEIPISVNKSEVLRIGVTGDMDCNSAQTKQFDLLRKYNVDVFLSGGDYDYNRGGCVLEELTKTGFTNSNSLIALGNHDSCSELRVWIGNSQCFGRETFGNGKLDVWAIDSNQPFDDSSSQFTSLNKSMMTSKAQYKIAVIHHPFVTADSKYEANGEFNTYHQLFKDSGVDIVLQAHNHNYQRFLIDNVSYYVVGTGMHDNGSLLYDIESNDFNEHRLLKGIDDQNGIAIFDLSTDIKQWFIDNSEQVLDTSLKKSRITNSNSALP